MTKIGFFLYSNKIAGVENYLANLINSWPNKNHKIYVFINHNFKHSLRLKKLLLESWKYYIIKIFLILILNQKKI